MQGPAEFWNIVHDLRRYVGLCLFWCTVYSNCEQSKHLFLENIHDASISNTSRIGPYRSDVLSLGGLGYL